MTTLDLRGTGGTLRLAPNGGQASVRSFVVVGPKGTDGRDGTNGAQGPQGLPGPNSVPADTAVASYVTSQSATKTALAATFAPLQVKVSDLPSPLVIAHRGGANLFPENTMEAYRGALGLGAKAVEFDCAFLGDRSVAVMHDADIARTSNGTGNVWEHTASTWTRLRADTDTYFAGGYGDLPLPFLADALALVGGQAVAFPEAKTGGSAPLTQAIIDQLKAKGLQQSAVIQCQDLVGAALCRDAGIAAMITTVTGLEVGTPAQYVAAGVKYAGVQASTVADSTISAFKAAGVKVIGYTLNRHAEVIAWQARGGDGWFSDDPLYSNGPNTGYVHVLPSMPWGAWSHGMLAAASSTRGIIATTPKPGVGWADATNLGTRALLLGNISPIKYNTNANSFTLEFDWTWTSAADTGRWVGAFVCCNNDLGINGLGVISGANGYRVLITPAGGIQIAKFTDNGSVGNLAANNFTALTLPGTYTLRIAVTPTQIIATNVTTNTSVTATDSTYRGGYVTLAASGVVATCTRAANTA